MKIEHAVWIFITALMLVGFAFLGTGDLHFDEAHYWMWSQRLAPAYFSKGPGVAFAIRASTMLFGDNEFGVRFFSPVLGAGSSLFLFYLARRLFDARAGMWAVIALNTTPLFNVGTVIMTIDPLSIFFWIATMWSFLRVMETSPKFSWHWVLTGLFIGLGFLCKYTNVFAIVSIIAVLALVPRLRVEFRRPGFYLCLALFALACVPPLLWNADHAWATLGHLQARGSLTSGFRIRPGEFAVFLGEHFLVYSPLICLAVFIAAIGSWQRARLQPSRLFLMWFGLPVFAFYAVLSFNKAPAPNWDALAFPGFFLLAIGFWKERLETSRAWRVAAAVALVVGLVCSVPILDTDLLRAAGLPVNRHDPANAMRGWKSATSALEQLRGDVEKRLGEKVFLIADARDRASEISFYLRDKRREGPGHPACYLVESQNIENQFSFWPRYDEFVPRPAGMANPEEQTYTEEGGVNLFTGRSALFVQDTGKPDLLHNISAAFSRVDVIARIEVTRFGKPVRRWDVYLCRNYRPLPL